MKVALIGVGQAGGKLAEALATDERGRRAVTDVLAVNTATVDLQPLGIETLLVGEARANGHGVGGDNELGARVMNEDVAEVVEEVDVGPECDALLVVAGLGGGTGSGGAPILARELSQVYDRPVYALGVLPGHDEGALYQRNAGRSLKTLAREADSVLLVDNDAWRSAGESLDEGFTAINERIADRIGLLLAAGEGVAATEAESVVDASEIHNTLRGGRLAAVGYASAESSDQADENVTAITSATRNALLTGTSLPDATTAAAALLVVAGDPERISRRGVEAARSWLGDETGTMQVRGGDAPVDSDRLAALVLLGGVERSDRVQSFLDRASDAADRDTGEDATESVTSDDLDGLF
ncbi:cell division protein [Halosegnis sp.]|uniref:cell division protein n=1 Tax=Halosegnis sp. TaxID=2864959 RepID=UPI0035D46E86